MSQIYDEDRHDYGPQMGDGLDSGSSPSSPSDPVPLPTRPRTRKISRPSKRSRTPHGTSDREHDRDPAHPPDHESTASALARLLDRGDARKLNSLLFITTERLNSETRRADTAESRAADFLARLRTTSEARDRAIADYGRASEELRLYKVQLDAAQREIFRAQDVIGRVEAERNEAEAEAARMRTKVRGLIEEKMVMIARDEGRKVGFKEGLARGRRMGFEAGRAAGYAEGQGEEYVEDEDEDEEEEAPPVITYRRTPSPPSIQLPRRSQSARPPSTRPIRINTNTHDTAQHAPTLPVPTLTTPIPVPSPSHAQAPRTHTHTHVHTPIPVPISAPSRSPEDIRPIPIHNRPSTASFHSADAVPPDNWIPVTRRGSQYFDVPPPHEMRAPHPPSPGLEDRAGHPDVRSRDYAYPTPRLARPQSAASRGSTRISQYELVSPPRHEARGARSATAVFHEPGRDERDVRRDRDRSMTPRLESRSGRSQTERIADEWRSANPDIASQSRAPSRGPSRNDRRPASPRVSGGPRRPRDLVMPTPLAGPSRQQQHQHHQPPPPPPPVPHEPPQRESPQSRPKSPFEFLRRRFRNRSISSPGVPQISVEPPSQSPSEGSVGTTVAEPHLLSPEDANRPLPPLDEPSHQPSNIPALTVPPVLPDGHLPPGFVPLSGPPVISTGRSTPDYFSHTARTENDAYHFTPVPQYATAPVPAGVTYPDPPRSATARPASPHTGSPKTGRRRNYSLSASSPAPLQRPISLFSEDD